MQTSIRGAAQLIGALAFFHAAAAMAEEPSLAVPKGYAVAEISVTDAEAYMAYVAAVGPLVEKFGGIYIVRGGETVAKEGGAPNGRIVVIEFPSLAAARAFYESPDYQAILPIRLNTATSRVYLVEGYAPR